MPLNLPVMSKLLKRDGLVSQRVSSKSCGREDGLMKIEDKWVYIEGIKNQTDTNRNILPRHKRFVLCSLMMECANFKEEKSAMEILLDELSANARGSFPTAQMLEVALILRIRRCTGQN